MSIGGPIFALVTPFAADGSVDQGALRELVAFLWERGVRTLIANGTTGEFPSLTLRDKMTVLNTVRDAFRGHIVCNVSSCSVDEVRALAAMSAEMCDTLLLLPPFYYAGAAEEGLLRFFEEALHDAPRPALIYNFPKHTQNPVSTALFARAVAQVGRIVGIKETTGDLETAKAKKAASPHALVFLGSDTHAFGALEAGIDGSVTGAGTAIPECLVQLQAAYRAGNTVLAARIQQEGDHWAAFRKEINLADIEIVKSALSFRLPGFPTAVRAPLVEPSEASRARIGAELRALQDRSIGIVWKR